MRSSPPPAPCRASRADEREARCAFRPQEWTASARRDVSQHRRKQRCMGEGARIGRPVTQELMKWQSDILRTSSSGRSLPGTAADRGRADQELRRRVRSATLPSRRGERAEHDLPGVGRERRHTAALTMRLLVESEIKPTGIVGAGFDEFRWLRPVRPGDELRLESQVLDVRPSKSRPEQGLIKVRTTTLNQNGEAVQILIANLVVPRRRRPSGRCRLSGI